MKRRHKYEYKIDINGSSAPATVVRMVGKDKKVLEIGAGPGSITRVLKEFNGCRVTAVELDKEAVKKLSPFCEHVYQIDLNDQNWASVLPQESKFEVIVAADVLEHLANPQDTLMLLRGIIDSHGDVIISLPHIGHCAAVACLSQDGFEMQDWGLLDKTHTHFFDIDKMQQLFDVTGFKIVDVKFIVLPPEQTELAYFWRQIPFESKKSLMSNRFGMVYQVVIKAKPDLSLERGLELSSLPIPAIELGMTRNATFNAKVIFSIKKYLLQYLHPHTRFKLRNFLYRVRLRF